MSGVNLALGCMHAHGALARGRQSKSPADCYICNMRAAARASPFCDRSAKMAGGAVQAKRLAQSAEDPEHDGQHCSEEDEVEASYKENFAGNAQAAVDEFMSNLDFLEREGDLAYVVPKGIIKKHLNIRIACNDQLSIITECKHKLGARLKLTVLWHNAMPSAFCSV